MVVYEVTQHDIYPRAEDESRCYFRLGDDEFLLDSEWRGSHRLVLTIATPVETEAGEEQCSYVKDNGDQCERDATDGEYCWQHP